MNRRDDGQVTAFVTLLMVAMLAMAGLVYDGGALITAKRRANNEAEAAARAGAAAVSHETLRGTGAIEVDPHRAVSAAQSYLATTGHAGSVNVSGNVVDVTVTFAQPLRILGFAGLVSLSVTGHGSARAARGVVTEEGR